MTTKITQINPDGSLVTQTTDSRTPEQKLGAKLTFKEKLDIMYPTNQVDVTKDWNSFDDHKRLK